VPAAPAHADVMSRLPVPPRDYLILFALVDGPLHGHGLLKSIEAQSGGVLFDPANLYRSLRKLDRDRLVVEVDDPGADASASRRRCYELTLLGRAVLTAEATRLARLAEAARARRLVRPEGAEG